MYSRFKSEPFSFESAPSRGRSSSGHRLKVLVEVRMKTKQLKCKLHKPTYKNWVTSGTASLPSIKLVHLILLLPLNQALIFVTICRIFFLLLPLPTAAAFTCCDHKHHSLTSSRVMCSFGKERCTLQTARLNMEQSSPLFEKKEKKLLTLQRIKNQI